MVALEIGRLYADAAARCVSRDIAVEPAARFAVIQCRFPLLSPD
jgi:hypothetical protein